MKTEKDFMSFISQRIRELRLKKGLTLEQAEENGFPSWRHLQKIEAGKNFTVITLYRIFKALDVTPEELFKNYKK